MDSKKLRNKTMSGLFWKFAERFSAQVISFIVSIVLARILMPDEYGVVALVTVIISLCDVFVNSGLGTALVQKKNADSQDYSTVFFFSLAMSILLYLIIFVAAPWIAIYFEKEILRSILRVMGLRLIVASLNTVQHAYVSSTMQFRKFFFSTISGTIASAFVGILMALAGMGAWALVGQYMVNSIIDTIVLFCTIEWKPKLQYSWKRWVGLFSYGWKLLVSSLVNAIYGNLRSLIIGKGYTSEDLAYYNKGKMFPELISDNILTTIENVLFPVIAQQQDERETVKKMVRRFIKTATYLISPLMIGLIAVAEPMVKLFLTEKWLFCVPYIQIYCLVGLLQPIQTANQQVYRALGRSDITLKVEIIKKVFGVLLLLYVMRFGVLAIGVSNLLYSCVALLINSFPNRKSIKYSVREQFKDVMENIVIAAVMGVVVYGMNYLEISTVIKIILQIFIGVIVYIGLSLVTRNTSFMYIKDMVLNKKNNRAKR